jgi:hypothetical protein
MRDALLTTGAVADAEAMIDQLRARALTVVDRFDVGYGLRAELVGMTERLVDRDR